MILSEVPTPAFVLDRTRLRANCRQMVARCRALGVRLRPHMKTLKTVEAARCALDSEHGGIAVASLNEAQFFADRDVTDIQYAVCMTPDKLPRAAQLLKQAPRFSFFVDSAYVAKRVMEFARANHASFRVWLEVDSGANRTGVDPEDPEVFKAAIALAAPPVIFEGVATHAGQAYRAASMAQIRQVAEQERRTVVAVAAKLRAAGFSVPGISAGSTPTAVQALSGEGLSELRAGVYMAGDLFQVSLGSLGLQDVAVSVLATVISQSRRHNRIVIDAGALALSKDRSTASGMGPDMGYGLVLDVGGRPIQPELSVCDVHQEHGEITASFPLPFNEMPIGSRVRIVPNHVCMTAAMYDRYLLVEGSERITGTWGRTNGWS